MISARAAFFGAPHLEGLPAFPTHERGDANEDDDEADAHHGINMRGFLELLDDLRAGLDADDGADDHDAAELEVNVAQRAMLAGGDDGLADDVGEIGADDEVHGDAHAKKGRADEKTAAHAEKSSEQSDDKTHGNQINRAEVGAGDEEIHLFIHPSPDETKQKAGEDLQQKALADDEEDCDRSVGFPFLAEKMIQPVAEKMEDEEEIAHDQPRINHQFDGE